MLRALGFKSSPSLSQDEINAKIANQALQLEKALKAMDYVLDDRAQEAFKMLDDHDNIAISQLAYGVVQFLEATLGFEPETMKKASQTLSKAESMAWKEKTDAEKNNVKSSQIYPPGTEFAVAYAESNLLNALLMLLSENFMEGAKALLKLRRAYQTLDSISKHLNTPLDASSSSLANLDSYTLCSNHGTDFVDLPLPLTEQEIKDKKIIDQLDQTYHMRLDRINGNHIGNPPVSDSLRTDLGFNDKNSIKPSSNDVLKFGNPQVASVDEYIHSGVNLCFGILQVVLSLIPQGIGKVLSVVGFKGSREAGLQMVWNAAQERNIHGGIGLLALLVFYDGPFQFTDVDFDIPTADELEAANKKFKHSQESTDALEKIKTNASSKSVTKKELLQDKITLERMATLGNGETLLHPGEKLVKVLLHSRALFPHSNLWLLQESRMLASRGRLHEAVELMDTAKPSQMKQVDALLGFDRCMILVFLHHFDRAAKDFLDLIKINSYSHALYTWFAAGCYLEAYRMCLTNNIPEDSDVDPSKIEEYAKLAEKNMHNAPKLIGQKKFLSKIPPFEKLIARKYKELNDTQAANPKIAFIDCVQTSLIHELAYFWNGYNRMSTQCLELSIKLLAYSASTPTKNNLSGVSSTSIASSISKKSSSTSIESISPISLSLDNKDTGLTYAKVFESKEQRMIRVTLQCLALRRLGYIKEGMQIFDKVVISNIVQPDGKLTKLNENPYLYPTALYERALFTWKINGADGLSECMRWLKDSQVYGGDDYELSTRVTMKTKAAIDRLEDLNF